MQKMGWLGGGTQGQRQCHHSIERIRLFLFDFNRNYVSILYRFRDIAGYLSKVADFDHPTCIRRPRRGDPVEFRGDLWHQKTRLPVVSCGVVCVILLFTVLVELRLVTDTDGQTQTDRHRPMASTADA